MTAYEEGYNRVVKTAFVGSMVDDAGSSLKNFAKELDENVTKGVRGGASPDSYYGDEVTEQVVKPYVEGMNKIRRSSDDNVNWMYPSDEVKKMENEIIESSDFDADPQVVFRSKERQDAIRLGQKIDKQSSSIAPGWKTYGGASVGLGGGGYALSSSLSNRSRNYGRSAYSSYPRYSSHTHSYGRGGYRGGRRYYNY